MTVRLDPSRASAAELQEAAARRVARLRRKCLPDRLAVALADHDDAAVILVSRSLAPVLDDLVFLSRMLSAAGLDRSSKPKNLTVVAAVVDEVPFYDRGLGFLCSGEGMSVLRGVASRILPGLLDGDSLKVDVAVQGQKPSLVFEPPPCRYAGPLTVTVPLANTLFSTGRPHTLFASRWQYEPSGFPRLVEQREITSQRIVLPAQGMAFSAKSVSSVLSYLIPLTVPHKIVAGLGNILRQIEIRGEPQPASTQLEELIPRLLETRRQAYRARQARLPPASRDSEDQDPVSGPVGVWALLIPPEYIANALPILSIANLAVPWCEKTTARITADQMDMLLAAGCQLRKVLSGGGGWGDKKGLLSLDPETGPTTDEHQDLESFIDSFKRQGSAGGIVTPGSYVQFFVDADVSRGYRPGLPQLSGWDPAQPSTAPIAVFGTPGAPTDSRYPIETRPNLFGAISSEGIYVCHKGDATDGPAIATKIDAPHSYMVSSAKFESAAGREIQGDLFKRIPLVLESLKTPETWWSKPAIPQPELSFWKKRPFTRGPKVGEGVGISTPREQQRTPPKPKKEPKKTSRTSVE